uniref:CRM domain-containing protein n=1 Tax=Kalanchoe fedtschenkoi TaxID=63787 RepID=A0A7N0TNU6_KALFE
MSLPLINPNLSPTAHFLPPFFSLLSSRPQPRRKAIFSSLNPKFKFRCSAASSSQIASQSAIERIAEKLRSLGYAEESKSDNASASVKLNPGEIFVPLPHHLPKRRVGHTIDTSWSTPENPVPRVGTGGAVVRVNELNEGVKREKWAAKEEAEAEGRRERVPTLAELSLPGEELWRLREVGKKVSTKLKVGKAGITEGVVNGIHERWRRSEVVRITCEDICRLNMKRTHDLLEMKTGGLVVWRSGSHIMLYRGDNYVYPYFTADDDVREEAVSSDKADRGPLSDSKTAEEEYVRKSLLSNQGDANSRLNEVNKKDGMPLIKGFGAQNIVRFQLPGETQLAEEVDRILEGLGPRFVDWWGCHPVPIDADLLPAIVPGYRKPFRLLPYGVYPKLTNDEMTTLRRLGRPVPCHFALGRNRNLQGLAASIVKLWEKCEIVKIAVKRGVQNTNSELMAEQLKVLTGGTLLSRDAEFIVFYRGKDFLPLAVSSAIEDRRKTYRLETKNHVTTDSSAVLDQHNFETSPITGNSASEDGISRVDVHVRCARKEQKDLQFEEAIIDNTSIALSVALEKKEKAEKLLEEIDEVEVTQQPEPDKEGITKEERYMLTKVGLRMKAFLLMGKRGVFAGTVENMHLHWKYRELIKIISNEKNTREVYRAARMLEAESGGILVAVEKVSKGYAIIIYRGKNYQRPASLRPKTLLTKREAMKRSIEAQRRKSLQLHVLKLSKHIDNMRQQLAAKDGASAEQVEELSTTSAVPQGEGTKSTDVGVAEFTNVYLGEEAGVISTPMVPSNCTGIATSRIDPDQRDNEADIIMEGANIPQTSDSRGSTAYGEPDLDSFVSENQTIETSVSGSNDTESSDRVSKDMIQMTNNTEMVRLSNGPPSPAGPLSNKERLLLRRQALSMKYRPVLAVGKSNSITGVAKTINKHFEKYPLAIVNVKGRAKGTSVQEVVIQLEQATGSVLVSQEPSKVILYRGWGAEQEYDRKGKIIKNRVKEMGEAETGPRGVSPELLAAIKLECGLLSNKERQDQTIAPELNFQ